jgi:hypothetical protein
MRPRTILLLRLVRTRELQRDLLRTRMVEFEGFRSLYRGATGFEDTGKQVKLDLLGGTIEMDRGMLGPHDPCLEHLLRNCVPTVSKVRKSALRLERIRWVDHRSFETRRQRRFCRLQRRAKDLT